MRTLVAVLAGAATATALGVGLAREDRYDLVIAGGRVVDGTGAPWLRADVGVTGDRIAAVGNLSGASAARRIAARDRVVAPGFIDMLGQSELTLLVDNRAESKIRQGITSEVTGEGGSVAPLNAEMTSDYQPWVDKYGVTVDWTDFTSYFKRLRAARPAINLGTFVGAAQVREYVLGKRDVQPAPAQLQRMVALVDAAMDQGALGLSTSLIYPPGSYARTPELVALARAAARHGGIYATHIRDEGPKEMAALDEAFTIGREAGIPVEIWHLKCAGRRNWGRMGEVVAAIERARAAGLDVSADMYPYVASGNGLDNTVPQWAHDGGVPKMIERFHDPKLRARILREIREGGAGSEGWKSRPPQDILIISVMNPDLRKWTGKRLSQVASEMGKAPEEALLDLVEADHANVFVARFSMNEDDLQVAMRKPWVAFDLDAGATAVDGPLGVDRHHPRAFGSMPRVLGRYVRELKVLRLEEAVRKMTSLPAGRMRFRDRGVLRPGMAADITVFDPERIRDVATFEDPNRYSEGVSYVVVNGRIVLDDGKLTAERPGRVLTLSR
jgi:dihydroorotase/N-acyl-D-amino-acid deacylase